MNICHACQRELDESSLAARRCSHCGAVVRPLAKRTLEERRSPLTPRTDTDDASEAASPTGRPSDPQRKSPTVPDRSDMTIEFPALAGGGAAGEPGAAGDSGEKSARRSTHTFESDKTIDFDMSPAEAARIDSQWRGTFQRGAKQGQTIRQRETVTGFRSSLPVKSRYIRERREKDARPPATLAEVPDYELLDIIGEGGMGVVYAAHQSSIARTVAVKMLKPSAKIREEQRDKFISEAVVTGELDHPNIVPIYDLGANDEGALFYSMKRVRGTPWDKVILQKQLDENLGILLRVADAVAFAHAGGVIHRDLKPENVMLGDFGEVLVMDWGLARITPDFANAGAVVQADNLGGTPAYMAPEMARGPVEHINTTSDVYLLGAILYEIIGGRPPHSGRDVMQCLMAASQNRIDAIRYEGELKAIALKAMATEQKDRYQSVKEFQEAIRTYQSHSESLVLSAHANQNLQKARGSDDYQLFARALYGFQESLTLWDGNVRARSLLAETQHDYAQCAFGKGDFDLAASLLDSANAEHQGLIARIEAGRAERDARQRRLRLAKIAVAALVAGIIVVSTVGYFGVRAEQQRTELARQDAVQQKDKAVVAEAEAVAQKNIAETQRQRAEEQTVIAVEQRQRAEQQTAIAVEQRGIAETAKQAEEYESYVARIGLAAAKVNDNAYGYAAELLRQSIPSGPDDRDFRNWEWGRLAYLCQLSAAVFDAAGPVDAVAFAPDGRSIASADWGGKLMIRDLGTGQVREVPHGQYVSCVDFSPDGRLIATGSSDRTIQIVDAGTGRVLARLGEQNGHTDGVLSVRFSRDGRQLVSGSYDNTARLWDLASRQSVQVLSGHSWWVWAADFSPDGQRIVTAGQDGKVIVWRKAEGGEQGGASRQARPNSQLSALSPQPVYVQQTEFSGHVGAVYSARFSPNGKVVASGGYDKLVMVWNPDDVKPIDIVGRLEGLSEPPEDYLRLAGHHGPVRSVTFSPNGELVASGGEDNAIRLWDVSTAVRLGIFEANESPTAVILTANDAASGDQGGDAPAENVQAENEGGTLGVAVKALRGHGNAVRSCVFSPDGQWILSGGQDKRVRLWNIQGYQEVRVLRSTVFRGHADAILSARFSRDGQQIITASRDRSAVLWNATTGARLKRLAEGHEFLATSAAFFPDGRHVATGAGDNTVRIWDITTGTQTGELAPTGRIGAVVVSPQGDVVVTGSPGSDVRVWSAESGQPIATLEGHTTEVSALAFSPTGELLATGDDRGRIRLWRRGDPTSALPGEDRGAAAWTFVRELQGHSRSISGMRFLPDGRRLVSASGDRTCAQWDVASGQELRDLVLKHADWVSSLDISADGTLAVTTCDDGQARLWRLADATQLAAIAAPQGAFNAVAFSPDGQTVALTSTGDRMVRIWNVSDRRAEAGAEAGVGVRSAASPQVNARMRPIAQPPTGAQPALAPLLDLTQVGLLWSATFAPDGRHILTIGGNDAQLWNMESRRSVVRLSPHGAVASADISPDGRLAATGSWDRSVKLWDTASGRAIRKLEGGHRGFINSVEFSPDGRELLTASDDATARIWNVESGQPGEITFSGHTGRVMCAAYSRDGARVLTAGSDKTARIWDRATGQPLYPPLVGHEWAVLCGQFSPDGARVITGSEDNAARIWDLAGGRQIVLAGHTAAITSVAFSPDGTRALTGSRDNSAKLWDAATGKEILSLPGHTQEVTSVSFSPDGRSVLTSSRDGLAIIWLAADWQTGR
jgi:WD40 repeat protein/serine/threonine protein kinase